MFIHTDNLFKHMSDLIHKIATKYAIRLSLTALALFWINIAVAQHKESKKKLDLADNLQYKVEAQAAYADGKTPLWLNANKYGLSSLEEKNGYVRATLERPLKTDSLRHWGLGFGLDMAVTQNFSSRVVAQQAYIEARWLHAAISLGSKQQPMQLKNNTLSTGSQTLGINARPVPQVRVELPDYWALPFFGGWVHFKGHVAYGIMTDDKWQKSFTDGDNSYTEGTLLHTKAGYLKIGKEDGYYPLSLELGLEMAGLFGGKAFVKQSDGSFRNYSGEKGAKAFLHVLMPGGSDDGESVYQNVAGDILGSWVARLNYDADTWKLSLYADKFFEDHSSMFQLDYDGYGEGEEWEKSKKRKFLVYDFKDMLLGAELSFKYDRFVRHLLFEYIYTKYQSGPIYHDHTPNMSDHIGGDDNFYNHLIFNGWQHWGMVMGNPLYLSPLYNEDGMIMVKDNRFKAYHLGADGGRNKFNWRMLATWQEGVGTYQNPYLKEKRNFSFMIEAGWRLGKNKSKSRWDLKCAYGMDLGKLLGDNYGAQVTLAYKGVVK